MSQPVRFYYQGRVHAIAGVDPTTPVLQYLRGPLRRPGTKEGCAEGDCGACTVVLGRPDGRGGMAYTPVNACIQLLPSLHGAWLITVEDLATFGDGGFHPLQEAFVTHHGSQCGFCTPGFVMASFAHRRRGGPTDRQSLRHAIAGNLCRCTGYGPILDAAEVAMDAHEPGFAEAEEAARRALEPIAAASDDIRLEGNGRVAYAPRRRADLLRFLGEDPTRTTLLAGATDIGLWVTKQHRDLPRLAYLGWLTDTPGVIEGGDTLTLGPTVTYGQAFPFLARWYPGMEELLWRFGSPPVRGAGTVLGNIANGSPIGDGMPAFIALGAELTLASPRGERHLALEALYLAYQCQDRGADELVAELRLPRLEPDEHFAAYKVTKRADQDISAVALGIKLRIQGERITAARLAYGGMAEVPKRAWRTEQALLNQPPTEAAVAPAAAALEEDFAPISDMRASAEYRRRVARNLLRRFFQEYSAGTPGGTHPRYAPVAFYA